MVYAQFDALDDVEFVLFHQVIDLGDRAVQVVGDGQDAVAAEALGNGVEHAFKAAHEHDARDGEQLLCGELRVCTLGALAGDGAGGGQIVCGV